MTHRKLFLSFVASAAAAAALAGATPSEAKFRRNSAAFCRPVSPDRSISFASGAATNDRTNADLMIICPLADDSAFSKTEIAGINVHAYDNHTWGNVLTGTCVQYYGSAGGACAPFAQSGRDTVSDVTLRPSVSEWGVGNEHHFPYLFVILSASQDNRTSKLYGYYTY